MRPWAIHVPVFVGELFSTWLVRAALAQGCDPIHLTGSLWPRWRAWTVDLDRGLTGDRLAVLSVRSGVDSERLKEAMLRPLLTAVAPSVPPEQSTWPWVLALGSRNRRRQGGLQFCPSCLDEDVTPYFRRSWRLAWHVGCAQHGRLLTDHCSACKAPAEPHRVRASDATLCRCPSCGHDMRRSVTRDMCPDDAMTFQRMADAVLKDGHGTWSASLVTCGDWFRMAHESASGRILGKAGDLAMPGITSLRLGLLRPSERVLRLRMALRAMKGESRGGPLIAKRTGVSSGCEGSDGDVHPRVVLTRLPRARPQAKVQGEWIRLLRRQRVGHT